MTTTNSVNKEMTSLIVGTIPSSESQDETAVPMKVRIDRAGTTELLVSNQTNNAASQAVFALSNLFNNSGTPQSVQAGNILYNDQFAGDASFAGCITLQSNFTGSDDATKGVIIYAKTSTSKVEVRIGASPAPLFAHWDSNGGQYMGYATNASPAAGFLGELITATATTGTLTNNTTTNITSISLTAGKWDVYAYVTFATSGTVAGNTFWACAVSTANNNLTGVGENGFGEDGGKIPVSANNFVSVTAGPTRVAISSTTTHYLNCKGEASVTFTNVTATGIIRAVRVG
jgi:hypothetical protein